MSEFAGEGTILSVGATSTVTAIAQVTNVSLSGEREGVDNFHLGSTIKTQRASGLKGPFSLSFSVFHDGTNAQHQDIYEAFVAGTTMYWKLETVDGAEYTFQGWVSSHEFNGMEVDSNLGADVEVNITTDITKVDPA